jgi:hypothetical protein
MALTRITVTLPAELVRAADTAAEAQDRSRSWIVADALRRGLATPGAPVREIPAVAHTATPHAEAFAAAQLQHLADDLALTPVERLTRLGEMAALTQHARRRSSRDQVLAFDAYDEFYAWKTRRRIAG